MSRVLNIQEVMQHLPHQIAPRAAQATGQVGDTLDGGPIEDESGAGEEVGVHNTIVRQRS